MNAQTTEKHPATAFGDDQVELADLATAIADEAAASLIQCACRRVGGDDHNWYDLLTCSLPDWYYVDRAVTYLERRGEASSHRLIRSSAFPQVVRFEERH